MLMGLGWLITGVFVLASFLMPQYEILNEGINGIDLIRMLDKDLSEVAKFIGVFTTFMMYFSLVFAMGTGVVASITGATALLKQRVGTWLPAMIMAMVAFGLHLFTAILLDSGDGEGMAFLTAKFKPEPAWPYYGTMFLFALMGLANLVLNMKGFLAPKPQSELGSSV